MKLSKRQSEIFEFIKNEVKTKGYPPSVREIGEAVGLASSSTVHGHLERLEQKGLIKRDPSKPRAIEVMDDSPKVATVNIPLLGKVTAGVPITAIENIEEYFPLPESMLTSDANLFMLKVDGESMINAGILDGDKLIVRQQNTAYDNDIVIAMTDEDEATCKRFFKEENRFRLQPENDTMAPIYLTNVTILGKVVGVFREM
ncbi:transcriptional repressor LexA [Brochothrix campestris]|uniref:LexA repressor n=1 Tax=Brochothrix campestris FSL F6-1037 TaxID=1265861 RepID=W7CW53_9LIST|nr:transcriptional repressor LexA [Brochothrix campestris]EUJ41177.1 LexA repressor [Brochothrix campestris FSL F6-1037]